VESSLLSLGWQGMRHSPVLHREWDRRAIQKTSPPWVLQKETRQEVGNKGAEQRCTLDHKITKSFQRNQRNTCNVSAAGNSSTCWRNWEGGRGSRIAGGGEKWGQTCVVGVWKQIGRALRTKGVCMTRFALLDHKITPWRRVDWVGGGGVNEGWGPATWLFF
jgi:hypothetical protein